MIRGLVRSVSGRIGALLVSVVVLCVLVSYVWVPHDPTEVVPSRRWAPMSASFPFGTDGGGRDLFSQVLVGARLTLVVVLATALLAAVIGVTLGVTAALAPGWLRSAIGHGIDILIALPTLVLALVLAAVFRGSALTAIVALGFGSGVVIARTVKAEVSLVLTQDYILAAHASGSSTLRMVRRHVLPNIASTLIVQLSLTLALAVLAEAALSYLGLGARPPTPSWGRMLSELQASATVHPTALIFPGAAVVLTTLGFNLLGDGLREASDPRLRRRGTDTVAAA